MYATIAIMLNGKHQHQTIYGTSEEIAVALLKAAETDDTFKNALQIIMHSHELAEEKGRKIAVKNMVTREIPFGQ